MPISSQVKPLGRRKIGLALCSGVARGRAHIGTLRALGRLGLIADLPGLLGPLRIEDLRIPFVAVATDLATGHEVWLQTGDLTETLRASFALPGLFPPIELDKRWLADGALVDPLPVAACRAPGADLVIAVNLNTDIIGQTRRSRRGASAFMGFDPSGRSWRKALKPRRPSSRIA
jgi:predicted acylesterase/phospholipase RssA